MARRINRNVPISDCSMLHDRHSELEVTTFQDLNEAWKTIEELKQGMQRVDTEIKQSQKRTRIPEAQLEKNKKTTDGSETAGRDHYTTVQETVLSPSPELKVRPMSRRVLNEPRAMAMPMKSSAPKESSLPSFAFTEPTNRESPTRWITYRSRPRERDSPTVKSLATQPAPTQSIKLLPQEQAVTEKKDEEETRSVPLGKQTLLSIPSALPHGLPNNQTASYSSEICSYQRSVKEAQWVQCEPDSPHPVPNKDSPQKIPRRVKCPTTITDSPPPSEANEDIRPKLCKKAVIPSSSVSGYRGFCHVEDLPAEERSPWKHLKLVRKKLASKKLEEAELKKQEAKMKKPASKQYTITPTTWKKELKPMRAAGDHQGITKVKHHMQQKEHTNTDEKTDERSSVLDESTAPHPYINNVECAVSEIINNALPKSIPITNLEDIGSSTVGKSEDAVSDNLPHYSSTWAASSSETAVKPVLKKVKREAERNVQTQIKKSYKDSPPKALPKKRTYDKKSTREYIKKQRQKRTEKYIEEIEKKKLEQKMKDQKLKDLQSKSEKLLKASLKRKKSDLTEKVMKEDDEIEGNKDYVDKAEVNLFTNTEEFTRKRELGSSPQRLISKRKDYHLKSESLGPGFSENRASAFKPISNQHFKMPFIEDTGNDCDYELQETKIIQLNNVHAVTDGTEAIKEPVLKNSNRFLEHTVSEHTIHPTSSTDILASDNSCSNAEAFKLTLGTQWRINAMNEKLQFALHLATQKREFSELSLKRNENVENLQESNDKPVKVVNKDKNSLAICSQCDDFKEVLIPKTDRDVTGILLGKLHELKKFVEDAEYTSPLKKSVITDGVMGSKTSITLPDNIESGKPAEEVRKESDVKTGRGPRIRIHEKIKEIPGSGSSSSSIQSVEKARERHKGRKLTTTYPKIVSPNEIIYIHHPKNVDDYPGIASLSKSFDTQDRHQAASKIQACYRGYQVRKSLAIRDILKSQAKEESHHQFFGNSNFKPLCEEYNENILKERLTEERRQEILEPPADWLQYEPLKACPYNFITAVKRKLDSIKRERELSDVESPLKVNTKEHKLVQTVPLSHNKLAQSLPISISGIRGTPIPDDASLLIPHHSQNDTEQKLLRTLPSSVSSVRGTAMPIELLPSKSKDAASCQSSLKATLESRSPLENMEKEQNLSFTSIEYDSIPSEDHKVFASTSYIASDRTDSSQSHPIPEITPASLVVPNVALVRTSDNQKNGSLLHKQQTKVFDSESQHEIRSIPLDHENQFASAVASGSKHNHIEVCERPLSTSESISTNSSTQKKSQKQTSLHSPSVSEKGSEGISNLNFSRPKLDKTDVNNLMHPMALHLQFQAELHLLNSVEESRRQLEKIENLRAVTVAQQSTSSMAAALKTLKELHKHEVSELGKKAAQDEEKLIEKFSREREEFEKILQEVKQKDIDSPDLSVSLESSTQDASSSIGKEIKHVPTHFQNQSSKGSKQRSRSCEDSKSHSSRTKLKSSPSQEVSRNGMANMVKTSPKSIEDVQSVEEITEALSHTPEYSSFVDTVDQGSPVTSKAVLSKSSSSSKIEDQVSSVSGIGESASPKLLVTSILNSIEKKTMSINKTISENMEDTSLDHSLVSLSEDISEQVLSKLGISKNTTPDISDDELSHVELSKSSLKNDLPRKSSLITTTYLMYDQMIKNEELRAIQHTALLNNQEKALIDRAKADMAWLEVKKSQLRERGKENMIPALKKKQRAIILKLQSDKNEIKRLRQVHQAASEERKLMLVQQQRMFKMYINRKCTSEKSKRRKSPQGAVGPLETPMPYSSSVSSEVNIKHTHTEGSHRSSKSKSSRSSADIQTELSEHLRSDSIDNGSQVNRKTESDPKNISFEQEETSQTTSSIVSEAPVLSSHKQNSPKKKQKKSLNEKVLKFMQTLERNESYLSEQERILQLRRQSVEELILKRKHLEEESKRISEKENQVIMQTMYSSSSQAKTNLQDRGTSPVEVLDNTSFVEKLDSKSRMSIISESFASVYDASFSQGSIAEDIPVKYSKTSDVSTQAVSVVDSQIHEQYTSEFFEFTETPDIPKTETPVQHTNSEIVEELEEMKTKSVSDEDKSKSNLKMVVKTKHSPELILKAPLLSPLQPNQQKRRYSSGSDESVVYSQTETPSEQSDLEGRVSALLEQLHKRKLEAEKLRREQKRARREKLKIKEQSLMKQIQAYDVYIQRTKEELLDQDFDTSFTKPKIKQPRVAERSASRCKEDQRKRLSLPFEPMCGDVSSDIDLSADKSQKECLETQGNVSKGSSLTQIPSEEDVCPSLGSVSASKEIIKSQDDDIESQSSIVDEAVGIELSLSSESAAVSVPEISDKEITGENIEEISIASEKSVSPESSTDTTIQSPIKVSEFDSETKEHDVHECAVDSEAIVPDIQSEISLVEETADNETEAVTEKEKTDLHSNKKMPPTDNDVSDEEHTTVSSSSASGVEDISGDKSPAVIKVFLSEKIARPDSHLDTAEVESHCESVNAKKNISPVSTDLKETDEFKQQDDRVSLAEDIFENEFVRDDTEEVTKKQNEKMDLADKLTNTILKELLQDSLHMPLKRKTALGKSYSVDSSEIVSQSLVNEDQLLPATPISKLTSIENVDILLSDQKEKNELKAETHKHDVLHSSMNEVEKDNVTSLVEQQLYNATDDIFRIYYKKQQQAEERVNTTPTTLESSPAASESDSIKRRVHEILAESSLVHSTTRESSRLQDFMVTTYDILSPSPEDTPTPGSPNKGHIEGRLHDFTSTAQKSSEKQSEVELGVGLSVGGESEGADNEGFSQEWFDEDFGLSNTRREAEELRLQQLQIEHEIQQLQQAQEQIPFFYVREIPNKPPPPYTPPSQTPRNTSPAPGVPTIPLSKQDLTQLATEETRVVPATSSDISALVTVATDYLYTALMSGRNLDLVDVPPNYYSDDEGEEECTEVQKNSKTTFKKFLFELSRQLVKEAYNWEADKACPAWEWPACSQRRKRMPPRSKEMLHEIVNRQVLVHFGFIPKANKENLVIRWSRKRRDYVDELLMRESHEEEPGWTNYDQDEVTLKNEVTTVIWNSLLDDTVKVFEDIFNKKVRAQEHKLSSSVTVTLCN